MQNRTFFILSAFLFCLCVLTPMNVFAQSDGTGLSALSLDEDADYMEDGATDIFDPWEGFNRKMFTFNDWVYRHLFNPVANAYDVIFPDFVQKRFEGITQLVHMPIRMFNNAFQGKFKKSGEEFGRFVVNASVGLGGMFDPAGRVFGWESHPEDFGQTLGVWGMDSGRYIVLPLFGPSNTRDLVGRIGDVALSPFTWLTVYDVEDQDAIRGFQIMRYAHNYAYDIRDDYEAVTEDALDPYSSIRHIYAELREQRIHDEESENEVFEGAYEK